MKNCIEGIGIVENGKIHISHNVSGDILIALKNTLENMRNQIVEEAKKHIGYPSIGYKNFESGMDIQGFDCSGFVTHILDKFGLKQEYIRHANEYFDSYGIAVHKGTIIPGDLIFFSKDGLVPKHIGIVISADEYIHAPGKNNTHIEIQKIEEKAIEGNIPGKIYTQNPIGFKRIIFESSDNKFDFNGTQRKRRTKII